MLQPFKYPKIYIIKDLLLMISFLPFLWLLYRFSTQGLGVNPIETVTRETGIWCLRFLLICLLMTPLKLIFKYHFAIQLRRMFGLYAYFYGVLHVITYVWFDQFFDFNAIWQDLFHRPFILFGFLSLFIMTWLAATSFNAMIRIMGGKKWQQLHRSVYIAAILACLHYLWLVKIDIKQPLIYGIILMILFLIRILFMLKRQNYRKKSDGRSSNI